MIDDVRGRAAYLAYRAGAELARVVPPAIGGVVADGLARAMRVVWPDRRAQVARTLGRVTGDALHGAALDHAVDEVFQNYARYWHEFFRLPDMSPRRRSCGPSTSRASSTSRPRSTAGRGAILALPHLGNWDLAGAHVAARGCRHGRGGRGGRAARAVRMVRASPAAGSGSTSSPSGPPREPR